jgi:hypothetical protein
VYGTVRTVVWEDGGGNPASYPRRTQGPAFRIRTLPNFAAALGGIAATVTQRCRC